MIIISVCIYTIYYLIVLILFNAINYLQSAICYICSDVAFRCEDEQMFWLFYTKMMLITSYMDDGNKSVLNPTAASIILPPLNSNYI